MNNVELENLYDEWNKIAHEKIESLVTKKMHAKVSFKKVDLSRYIDNYIKWCFKNTVYSEFKDQKYDFKCYKDEILNLIEKMAVWYELRFPSYELNRLMSLDKETLKNNGNIYNYDDFYKNLNSTEKEFLTNPSYSDMVYFSESTGSHVLLDNEGYIIDATDFYPIVDSGKKRIVITRNTYGFGKQFEGCHVKEIQTYLREKGIKCSEVDSTIISYDNAIKIREGFLNSVMLRIIERDRENGSKRAFLFAKEFERNINIPMMYAPSEDDFVYELDNDFKVFINEYLKSGGRKDLICLVDYVPYLSSFNKLDTISLLEIIMKDENFISASEKEIKLMILNLLKLKLKEKEKELGLTVDEARKIREEEIYEKRLARRLEKSRNR